MLLLTNDQCVTSSSTDHGSVPFSDSRIQVKSKTTSIDLAQTMMADFTRVRGESVMQLNANRRYRVKDTYKPEDLNPYKREQERAKNRSTKISKLMHKGTLFEKHDRLPYMPEQVRLLSDIQKSMLIFSHAQTLHWFHTIELQTINLFCRFIFPVMCRYGERSASRMFQC